MQTEFDHFVVGGGSAGCAVVARLADQPGAQERKLLVRLPHRHPNGDAFDAKERTAT